MDTRRRTRTRSRLPWLVISVGALLAASATNGAAQACSQLDQAALKRLAPDPASVARIQTGLAEAYIDRTGTDAARVRAFVDGIVGPRTTTLAQTFCRALGLGEGEASTEFLKGLDAFHSVVAAHPEWSKTVSTAAFATWAAKLPGGRHFPWYYLPDRGPSLPTSALLLPEYLARVPSAGLFQGMFVLTKAALDSLAQAPLDTLYTVSEASITRFVAAGAPPALVEAMKAMRQLPAKTRAEAGSEARKTIDSFRAQDSTTSNGKTGTGSLTAARARRLERMVDIETTPPGVALLGDSVPPEALDALKKLEGIRFPNGYLFRQALRVLAGRSVADPAVLSRIMAAAHVSTQEPSTAELGLKPIAWDGSTCGCGTFVRASDQYPLYLYGMYPYWNAPQQADSADDTRPPPQPVDFSHLTRIGYFALTFDKNGVISSPLHWKKGSWPADAGLPWRRSGFADFIETAHRHKTNVDAVLYNSDWKGWLPPANGTAQDTAETLTQDKAALSRLFGQADSLISADLDDAMDRIKPFISLGQSPRRTLGDGITLDLEFQGVSSQDQEWLFTLVSQSLVPGLRRRLRESGGATRSRLIFNLDRRYFLNIMVPGYCLTAPPGKGVPDGCAFYTMKNIGKLSRYLDLLLVDFARKPLEATASTAATMSPLELAEGLDKALDALPVDQSLSLVQKVIPMVVGGPDSTAVPPLDSLFQYSNWHFGGAGVWSVPIPPAVNNALGAAFLEAPTRVPQSQLGALVDKVVTKPAKELQATVCRYTCPWRWPLRTAVFLFTLGIVVILVTTKIYYEGEWIYRTKWFRLGVVVTFVFLIDSLWCDPYWSQKQPVILFACLLGVFIYSTVTLVRRKREKDYP